MISRNRPSILEVPEIHSDQFDKLKNGTIKQNVNLFRGNVNFIFPLVSFTGRNGLNVNIGAQYGSNTHYVASRRNIENPTGILGLGWALSYDKIVADYNNANAPGTITYKYESGGSANLLYRVNTLWQRGVLAANMESELNKSIISSTLQSAILGQSILVSNTAELVIVIAGEKWHLTDSVNEVSLIMTKKGSSIDIFDGGILYEAESYNFSRIRYYSEYEKWAVTDTNGITKTFGGGVKDDANGYKSSLGNSIQWSVRWGNWQGPSIVTHNSNGDRVQQQCPLIWNLASTHSRWHDQVNYEYLQTTQLVGSNGLPYTKACYLAKVTGVFGRSATFHYGDKLYDANGPQQPREFADPNKPIPNNIADAYQSKYETKFLDSISIASKENETLFHWKFAYAIQQFASLAGGSPPDLFGNTMKRVLTGISKVMPSGLSLPAELYSYYQSSNPNPGALETRTYKEGAITTYHYAKTDLTSCSRSLTVNSPNQNETPRVWFGADYAVVLWYDAGGRLYISAYTWIGRWVKWQPKSSPVNTSIDLDSLNVDTQNDSFVISFGSENDQDYYVFPYYKDPLILGGWLEDAKSPITIQASTKNVETIVGQNYFVINDISTNEVSRYTWSPTQKEWISDILYPASGPFGKNRYFLSAANNVLIALNYDIKSSPKSKKNTLELFYLDELFNWSKGDSINAPEINISTNQLQSNFNWTPAPWVFIATYVTGKTQSSLDYNLSIYSWSNKSGNTYKFEPVVVKSYSQNLTANGTSVVPYVAQLSSSGLIISGPNLLRYNGAEWLENDHLSIQIAVDDQNLYWFAHGADVVLKTENSPNQIISAAQAFDPNTETSKWTEKSISIFDNQPIDPRLNHYYPTGGNGYVSFNKNLYQRGSSTDWKSPFNNPIQPPLPADANITSLINESPFFFAYLFEQSGGALNTQLLMVDNGTIQLGPAIPQNFFALIDAKGHPVSGSNGKIPAGALSFITYAPLTAEFENATSLTLYRFLNADMVNTFNSYPVYQVEVDDGFSKVATNYEFNFANAAIDPSGIIAKFYSAIVYQGTDPTKKFGWNEFTFMNGIGLHPTTGNPASPAGFDGLKESVTTYDAAGQKLKATTYEWSIYSKILETPNAAQDSPIRGSYAVPKSITEMLDGVSSQKNFTYDLASGQQLTQVSSEYNSAGKLQYLTNDKKYAFHVFEGLWYAHCLKGLAQTKSSIQVQNENAVVASVQATTWKTFEGQEGQSSNALFAWASFETYKWMGGTASSDFDFVSWQQGVQPPFDFGSFTGWLKKSSIGQRNKFGSTELSIDAMQRSHSVIFDDIGQFKIAKFFAANTVDQEASYFGFEIYENAFNWQINTPAVVVNTNAYTGQRSLCLLKNGTLENHFNPTDQKKNYVFGWWYSTSVGFQKSNGSGVQINLTQNGNPISGQSQIIPFEETSGEWVFGFAKIVIGNVGGGNPVSIDVKAMSNSNSEILIDNIRFLPDVAHFSSQVYHPSHKLLTEKIEMGTRLTRSVYDPFFQEIGQVGPYQNQARKYKHSFLSRQVRATIDSTLPNHTFTSYALGGGDVESFKGGELWKKRWSVSNLNNNWESGNGTLVHSSDSESDTITSIQSKLDQNFGLYFQLSNPDKNEPLSFSDGFGVEINSQNKFLWDVTNKQWNLTVDGKTETPLHANTDLPYLILLLSTPKSLLFFVNNELILSVNPTQALTGPVIITTGKNKIAFTNLAGFITPNAQINFVDGAEKLRQKQALINGNAMVAEMIYNEVGKKVVATKNAPTRFGTTGSNLPLLTYNNDFADVTAFLSTIETTGLLSGNVSTYYNGINNASNDENYPYSRNRLEKSPMTRVVEIGRAGKDYAIINPNTSNPNSRPTTKFAYTNNKSNNFNLPAGEYFVHSKEDQLGNVAFQIIGKSKQVFLKSSGVAKSQKKQLFTSDGKTINHLFPNYFDSNLVDHNNFIQSIKYNLLGKVSEISHPDEGTTSTIQNAGGHKRFYQDADGAQNGYFIYIKYDDLNRILEKGIYSGSWDENTLRQHTEDPSWPMNDPCQNIQNQIEYVLHDGTVNGIGKIQSATSYNVHSGMNVKETFSYDDESQLKSKSVLITDGGTSVQNATIQMDKSFTGKTTKITYPSSVAPGMPDVLYSYDQLDRLIGIGVNSEPYKFAKYAYNEAGELQALSTNKEKIAHNYNYYPAGWLKSITNSTGSTTFNQLINQRYANSKVKSIQDSIHAQTTTESLQYNVDFDALNQLSHAQYNGKPDWTVAINAYDVNGNILNMTQGSETAESSYGLGKNQLTSVKTGKTFNFQGTYNGKGDTQTIENPNHSLELNYVKGRGLTAHIDLKKTSEALKFSYDHNGNRAVKNLSGGGQTKSQKIYLRGEHPLPLIETNNSDSIAYIYGQKGLVAFYKNQKFYFVTQDHLGSNRTVQDENGNTIAIYNFETYGKLGSSGGTNPSILDYLFTGQEFDSETNQYNYRARIYDPSIGRFISPDPKNQTASPYVYAGNDPFDFTDPTGESFLGDLFSWIAQIVVDVVEVVAAVAIDVVTDGAGTVFTGGLLGAGMNGAAYDIGALATHQKVSWKDYGEAQTIGAVTGAATAGFGELGTAAETGIQSSVEEGASAGTKLAYSAAGKAANIGIQAAGGAVTGMSGALIENAFSGDPAGRGVGTDALIGFLTGGIGGSIGQTGDWLAGENPTMGKKILKAAIGGVVGATAGGLIVAGIEKQKINGFDLGLAIGMGAVENLAGIRNQKAEAEEFSPTIDDPVVNDSFGNRAITNEDL